MSTYRLICADVIEGLRQLPDESVDCIVTSPPYWGLRSYGTQPQIWDADPDCQHEWGETVRTPWANDVPGPNGRVKNLQASRKAKWTGPFCTRCRAWRGELGSEPTYQLYIAHVVAVFTQARRVLSKTGTAWLNIGDCFATGAGKVGQCPGGGEQGTRWAGPITQPNRLPQPGLKPKDLCMIPHRVAIALQEAGWWVRMDIVWAKPNPMPESVSDRPTDSHEYVFLLAKSERYSYNADAIREPYVGITQHDQTGQGYIAPGQTPQRSNRATSHKGSSFSQGKTGVNGLGRVSEAERKDNPGGRNKRSVWTINTEPYPGAHFAVMPEALVEPCILAGCPEGGTTLDPFCGTGTVGAVALLSRRNFIGIDLNPEYIEIARHRIYQASSPLLEDMEATA